MFWYKHQSKQILELINTPLDLYHSFRTTQKTALVSKKGVFLKEILSCGKGYYHQKKIATDNFYYSRPGGPKEFEINTPDFKVIFFSIIIAQTSIHILI